MDMTREYFQQPNSPHISYLVNCDALLMWKVDIKSDTLQIGSASKRSSGVIKTSQVNNNSKGNIQENISEQILGMPKKLGCNGPLLIICSSSKLDQTRPLDAAFSSPESQEHVFYLLIIVPHFDLCFLKTEEIGCSGTLQTHLLPSAAISDRGCTLGISKQDLCETLTEADGHYTASLS